MSTEKRGVKRAGAQRASRHSKKYLRKGTDVSIYEDFLHEKAEEKRIGASVENVADDDIFTVDRQPDTEKPKEKKFTKRQKAALDKISKSSDKGVVKLPEPKAPSKSSMPKLNRVKVTGSAKVLPKKKESNYDLWTVDFVPKVDHSIKHAGEHYLRTVKGKAPRKPKSVGKTTSFLHAVEVVDAGASYNPTTEDYQAYVADIAKDEYKLIAEEQRIDRGLKPQVEAYVTEKDRDMELLEGLPNDPRNREDDTEDKDEEVPVPDISPITEIKDEESKKAPRRTKKQREEIAARLKLEKKQHDQKKTFDRQQQDIFKSKEINKEIEDEDTKQTKETKDRQKQKVFDMMTKRQRLGRGRFTEDKEFLLAEELSGNLRQLKPQGNVLLDRMKSMQKRNILPIAGDRNKKRIRKNLKRKFSEKRATREVAQGSRVI